MEDFAFYYRYTGFMGDDRAQNVRKGEFEVSLGAEKKGRSMLAGQYNVLKKPKSSCKSIVYFVIDALVIRKASSESLGYSYFANVQRKVLLLNRATFSLMVHRMFHLLRGHDLAA